MEFNSVALGTFMGQPQKGLAEDGSQGDWLQRMFQAHCEELKGQRVMLTDSSLPESKTGVQSSSATKDDYRFEIVLITSPLIKATNFLRPGSTSFNLQEWTIKNDYIF